MQTIRYQERKGISGRHAAWGVLAGIALISIGFFVSALCFIAGILLVIISLTAWSVRRYSEIVLSDTVLMVGRDSVLLEGVDATFGVVRGESALSEKQLWSLELGVSSTRKGMKILGGAFGRTKQHDWLVMRGKDETLLLVASSRPQELQDALAAWLSGTMK